MKCNSILLCFLLAIAANSFTAAKAQAVNVNDSLALVDLYNSTDGNHWNKHTNWLTTNPVSTWYGVTVTDNRVTRLYLLSDNLSGNIPGSIGNLVNLTYLELAHNKLTGIIPAEIGNLVKLTDLYLSSNRLRGEIPAEIGNLVKLKTLYLSQNKLTGAIPAALGNLVNLIDLRSYKNKLSRNIPATIGNLVNLQTLILYDNQLSGPIPAALGNLASIEELSLYDNQLTGAIPATFGNLVNLRALVLSSNRLTGSIPDTLGRLTKLGQLILSSNQLTGSIPATFRNLSQLYYIDVSYNQLSQDKNFNISIDSTSSADGSLSYNLFTFDGLQFIAQKYHSIRYAPQNTVLPIHQNGSTLSVYAGGSLSNNTYIWHKAGAIDSIVIKHDSTFTPAESGMYYVTVKNKVAKQLILHSDTTDFVMPLVQSNTTSLAAKTISIHFSVYPNPAKDIVHIQTNGIAIISITNSAGKILLNKSINNNGNINVSTFANGIYYIQNKTTGEVEKVVVVH